jgi:hypothetical protein
MLHRSAGAGMLALCFSFYWSRVHERFELLGIFAVMRLAT